jgi:hypothetical protein
MKHIDVIAIAALLAGAALYSEARETALFHIQSYKTAAFSQVIQRAMRCPHTARAVRALHVDRTFTTPLGHPKVSVFVSSD